MHHISPVRSDFVQYTPTSGVVSLGGHAEIRQIGIGTIVIRAQIGDRSTKITLHNVLHVPDVDTCYFSITVLLEKGGMITFKDKSFTISIGNTDLAIEIGRAHV